MKKKDCLFLCILAAILLTAVSFTYFRAPKEGDLIRITEDGNVIGTYPLTEDRTVNLGHNTVIINSGKAYISEADCPDRLCVKQGQISKIGQVIACLPNRVTVEVITDNAGSLSSFPISYSGLHFDTVVNVTVYDMDPKVSLPSESDNDPDTDLYPSKDMPVNTAICDMIREECERYELICSRTNGSSELYMLNHDLISEKKEVSITGSPNTAYKVSPELYDMIAAGVEYGDRTGGIFDIAIAPLCELWDFKSGSDIIPSKGDIDAVLPHLSYRSIVLLDDGYIAFTDPKCRIDLGGLAKGYIGDRLRDMLISHGVTSAVISLGGNVVTIGSKDGRPFNVGIRKPFGSVAETVTTVASSDSCVITSGTYERFFTKNGVLYHHVLDAETGYPYDTDLTGATVICSSSLQGDILSTVLLAEGSDAAVKHAKALETEGIYVILTDKDNDILFDNRPDRAK